MGKSEITPEQLAEHPLLAALLLVVSSIGFMLTVGAIATWIWLGFRWKRGEPILPIQPWRPRVWGLLDLAFVFMTVVASQITSIRLAQRLLGLQVTHEFSEKQMPLSAMALIGLGNMVAVLIVSAWIAIRHQASREQLGFGIKNLRREIKIGFVAALGSLPVVYLLMFVVSQGTSIEYDHPLITKMLEDATLDSFLIGCFSAVIAAPLTEEFLFRVILQGWLQSISRGWIGLTWFWGASERKRDLSYIAPDGDVPSDSPALVDDFSSETPKADLAPPLWPVFVSGTLFGFAHWGYGLSFVPLIALGIVLGLLYRATHSIWPSLVVHVTLNLISMLALALAIVAQQAGFDT